MPEHRGVSVSGGADEYLEAAYKLASDDGSVSVPALAQHLGVSAASANEMVRKLAERGLMSYEPYRGVSLTEAGRRKALVLIRRHRLWERFLTDVLNIPWDCVHDEACRLEHATSPMVEEKLAEFLEAPRTCPHGHAVPSAAGKLVQEKTVSLVDLSPGEDAIVVCVPEEDSSLLRYLDSLGLRPSRSVSVVSVEPFDGPVTIMVEGRLRAIGKGLGSRIAVRPIRGDQG